MKCPECGFHQARFVDKKLEDVREVREHRLKTGSSYTSTITKKKAVYKRGYCPKCKHTWEEAE